VFSWFFGSTPTAHTKLTVEVSAGKHDRNRIVTTPAYNLRPRRTAVNYKEPVSDAEDSDTASEA
jgi:hypothetical protein